MCQALPPDLCWIYAGNILDLYWICAGYMLDLHWICAGNMLDLYWIWVGLICLCFLIPLSGQDRAFLEANCPNHLKSCCFAACFFMLWAIRWWCWRLLPTLSQFRGQFTIGTALNCPNGFKSCYFPARFGQSNDEACGACPNGQHVTTSEAACPTISQRTINFWRHLLNLGCCYATSDTACPTPYRLFFRTFFITTNTSRNATGNMTFFIIWNVFSCILFCKNNTFYNY